LGFAHYFSDGGEMQSIEVCDLLVTVSSCRIGRHDTLVAILVSRRQLFKVWVEKETTAQRLRP